jgi:hypothetical protein
MKTAISMTEETALLYNIGFNILSKRIVRMIKFFEYLIWIVCKPISAFKFPF